MNRRSLGTTLKNQSTGHLPNYRPSDVDASCNGSRNGRNLSCTSDTCPTPALTTRGLGEADMATVTAWLDRVMASKGDPTVTSEVRGEIRDFCERFPLPH